MSAKNILGLLVALLALLAEPGHRVNAQKPPAKKQEIKGLAKEVVKMEVQRNFDAQMRPAKDTKTIEDQEKIARLLALFPEVGTKKEPDGFGPAGYSAGYFITLHRKKGDPLYIVISHNRKFWCWSEGKTVTNGDWNLKNADKVEKVLLDLLK